MVCFIFRKAVLPTEAELKPDSSGSFIDVEQTQHLVSRMKEIEDSIHCTAKKNIEKSQLKYKQDHDRKHSRATVRCLFPN